MTYQKLYSTLNCVDHSRDKRMEMSTLMLNRPENIGLLIQIAFQVNDPISCKACWVLEFTAKNRLNLLLPYMDQFTKNIGSVYLHSAVRPIAKICEYLMKSYFINNNTATCGALNEDHLSLITATCFDWLIGNHKVAAQAYSMTCLLLLGQKFNWIRPELRMVLEQNYQHGSAAYRARARMTLAKIK